MNIKSLRRLMLGLAPLVLAACSTVPSGGGDADRGASASKAKTNNVDMSSNPARKTMQSGIDALNGGDAKRANQIFTLAQSPGLHVDRPRYCNIRAYMLSITCRH
ncbi:MAG: hypothetical protein WC742_15250 [Gallionellaceae bacterium]